MADAQPVPIQIKPGIVKTSTAAGVGQQWFDGHLVRWVGGRLRPIQGWEKADLPAPFPLSPIRAVHMWTDQAGVERLGILCESHLYVLHGSNLLDVTPIGGITGPGSSLLPGGYGGGLYDQGTYDTPRPARPNIRAIGFSWRLANWGEDLLAMCSTDGRLLRWEPGTANAVTVVDTTQTPDYTPTGRTFVVTPERHVMIFGLEGKVNKFGWCSQENITDWDYSSLTNSAGFYEIEPASAIVDAAVTRYSVIFWTVQGAYVVTYKAMPYIYSYDFAGAFTGPLASGAAVAFSSRVIWPATDGFWQFDGNSITQVACPILDWFQQTRDPARTTFNIAGWFNGATSEVWWGFPSVGQIENDRVIIYNFEERWWSMGKLKRSCGYPSTMSSWPVMASPTTVYRHEKNEFYGADLEELPWVRSGAINIANGTTMATVRQILVDTDAPRDAVNYQLSATKGRYAGAAERVGDVKLPRVDGKIDYRITGRDVFLKMQSAKSGVTWSFGQGQLLTAPRGRKLATGAS